MRLLLDECLPKKAEMGWAGKKNGELIALAVEHGFHAFITADQNLTYQQNLKHSPIAIIVLKAPNTRLESLLPLLPKIRAVLPNIGAGEVLSIDA